MKIVDLHPSDFGTVRQVAALLIDAFARIPNFVKTADEATAEISESFAPGRVSRVALDDNGNAAGWAGGIVQYDGNVYELHPLAVRPDAQRQGIGRALVRDFEEQARQCGATTVILGADDIYGGTSLYGADVYPDVCREIAGIRNIGNHPFEFYQKCGYAIVGLVPDANGFGKPDILMAKRVAFPAGRHEDVGQ